MFIFFQKHTTHNARNRYAQCAGFLRIPNGLCAYDNTNVHPESYDVAEWLDHNCSIEEAAEKTNRSIEDVETILRYLESPGHLTDPRNNIPIPEPRRFSSHHDT